MRSWQAYLIAAAVLIALAPLFAWAGRRLGRSAKAGVALAGLMLGLGEVMDPPSKHLIEAGDEADKAPPAPGDPPTTP
ncbi:MAG: hypothetical protein ACHP84_14165 [Caulobacterales bacterium]|jgi:hypothetical protein